MKESGALMVAALWLLFAAPIIQADTYHVPGDYGTIQEALSTAADGDTVLVADGIYRGESNRNLSYRGRSIHLASENGPACCIIDCEGQGPGVVFDWEEGKNAVLEGFTIRNGTADD
ncbi:hypothetical protein JW905_02885 [bacterium]|nr:hypothetical protein [candidate division CSSED10-310 bacterium]